MNGTFPLNSEIIYQLMRHLQLTYVHDELLEHHAFIVLLDDC